MKKALYIDIAFWGINDGGANRSKFLWNSLVSQYEVDWLELRREGIPEGKGLPTGLNNHFVLETEVDNRFFFPVIIYRFRRKAKKKYQQILRANRYDLVFIRFLSPARLARAAKEMVKVIVLDVDMLLSRLAKMSWQQRPVLKNRYYLIESIKLQAFEKYFFSNPYIFLFTNSSEKNFLLETLKIPEPDRLQVLPNVMEEVETRIPDPQNRILFFGTLNSAANADALQYISEEIYNQIEPELEKRQIYLDVAGRGWHARLERFFAGKKRLRYIGEVDDIQQEICNSLLVFLPLRIASGTRTRILEVANQSVPVLTTPIGVEGLELGNDEIVVAENSENLIRELISLLDNESRRNILGQKLKLKSRALYLAKNVRSSLIGLLEKELEK